MSIANPFWGAPRIHGELLKLGIDVSQTTVAKYVAKARRPVCTENLIRVEYATESPKLAQ